MDWLLLLIGIIVLFFGFVVFRGSPYVPSRKKYIRQAFKKLYPLTSADLLVDIGSGDGIVLREAAKTGALAVGYEINPILVLISRLLSRKHNRITIHLANFWTSSLPNETTVVYVFSVTRDMRKIIEKLQVETNWLAHPLNIISFGSEFQDIKLVKKLGPYHLYILYPLA